jgi:DNA mismatch repair protein MutS
MQDLEHAQLFDSIKAFALSMNSVHALLAELEKLYYEHQKERWFVDAVTIYGEAVNRLVQDLAAARLRSRGMLAFKEYLSQYASSDYFTSLIEEAQRLEAELSSIRYSVFIHGGHVEVHRYLNKPDYSAEIEATFERFQQGAVQAYTFKFSDAPEMNHIEAQILDGVALLHGDTFSKLGNYRANNQDFLDPTLLRGDNYLGRSCCLT